MLMTKFRIFALLIFANHLFFRFSKNAKTDSFFSGFRECVVTAINSYTPSHNWSQKYKLLIFSNVIALRKLQDKMIHFKMILSSLSVNNFLLSSSYLCDVKNILLDAMYSKKQMFKMRCK